MSSFNPNKNHKNIILVALDRAQKEYKGLAW